MTTFTAYHVHLMKLQTGAELAAGVLNLGSVDQASRARVLHESAGLMIGYLWTINSLMCRELGHAQFAGVLDALSGIQSTAKEWAGLRITEWAEFAARIDGALKIVQDFVDGEFARHARTAQQQTADV